MQGEKTQKVGFYIKLVLTDFSIKLAIYNSDQLNLCKVDRSTNNRP
jgi:hypothetical protein